MFSQNPKVDPTQTQTKHSLQAKQKPFFKNMMTKLEQHLSINDNNKKNQDQLEETSDHSSEAGSTVSTRSSRVRQSRTLSKKNMVRRCSPVRTSMTTTRRTSRQERISVQQQATADLFLLGQYDSENDDDDSDSDSICSITATTCHGVNNEIIKNNNNNNRNRRSMLTRSKTCYGGMPSSSTSLRDLKSYRPSFGVIAIPEDQTASLRRSNTTPNATRSSSRRSTSTTANRRPTLSGKSTSDRALLMRNSMASMAA